MNIITYDYLYLYWLAYFKDSTWLTLAEQIRLTLFDLRHKCTSKNYTVIWNKYLSA